MEDAMILNKSAVDRGLAHGTVIKSETVDLHDDKGKHMYFATEQAGPRDKHSFPVSALGQKFPQNVPGQQGSAATITQRVAKQVRPRGPMRKRPRQWCRDETSSIRMAGVQIEST